MSLAPLNTGGNERATSEGYCRDSVGSSLESAFCASGSVERSAGGAVLALTYALPVPHDEAFAYPLTVLEFLRRAHWKRRLEIRKGFLSWVEPRQNYQGVSSGAPAHSHVCDRAGWSSLIQQIHKKAH